MRRELHHYLKRKKSQSSGKRIKLTPAQRTMDRLIYLITPITVLIFVPQLIKIYTEQNASGLSIISWLGMLAGSVFWFTYGLVHKEKPLMFVNTSIGIIQLLIVIGILIYK